MSYRIAFYELEDGRGIKLLGAGRVPGQELVASNQVFQERFGERFRGAEFWLSDYRELDASEVSVDHSRSIANIAMGTGRSDLVLAILCTRQLEFAMTRMWEGQAAPTGWTMAVFNDPASMDDWFVEHLGRTVDPDGGTLLMDWVPER